MKLQFDGFGRWTSDGLPAASERSSSMVYDQPHSQPQRSTNKHVQDSLWPSKCNNTRNEGPVASVRLGSSGRVSMSNHTPPH